MNDKVDVQECSDCKILENNSFRKLQKAYEQLDRIKELCNKASKSNWKCMELVYEILEILESEG